MYRGTTNILSRCKLPAGEHGFSDYAIFPHLKLKQNIGCTLRKDKPPIAEFDAKVAEMLEHIKLPGYENSASHEPLSEDCQALHRDHQRWQV